MMFRASTATLVALIVVSGTGLAASSGRLEGRMDSPSQMTMLIDGTLDGQDAQQMRSQIDQTGNKDGQVSAAEVDAMEQMMMDLFKQYASDPDSSSSNTGGDFTIDGKGPTKFEFMAINFEGAQGAVTSTSPIQAHMELRLTFPVEAGERHTLHLATEGNEDDDSQGGGGGFDWEYGGAKLRAPGGYIFETVTGLPPGASVSGDKKTVDFGTAYQQAFSADFVFVKGGGGGGIGGIAPGVGLAVFAAFLVGAMVLRRRLGRDSGG